MNVLDLPIEAGFHQCGDGGGGGGKGSKGGAKAAKQKAGGKADRDFNRSVSSSDPGGANPRSLNITRQRTRQIKRGSVDNNTTVQ